MAAEAVYRSADLTNIPSDFSLVYLKDIAISLKSKQQGFKYFSEGYFHDVNMVKDDNTVITTAKCYRSQRKSEKPHNVSVDISGDRVSYALCSCQAG